MFKALFLLSILGVCGCATIRTIKGDLVSTTDSSNHTLSVEDNDVVTESTSNITFTNRTIPIFSNETITPFSNGTIATEGSILDSTYKQKMCNLSKDKADMILRLVLAFQTSPQQFLKYVEEVKEAFLTIKKDINLKKGDLFDRDNFDRVIAAWKKEDSNIAAGIDTDFETILLAFTNFSLTFDEMIVEVNEIYDALKEISPMNTISTKILQAGKEENSTASDQTVKFLSILLSV
uniref:Lipoprotein n=1 Tax=Rhabditophanes sp. KR3021 TaxID=114890 RepID=A0AC35TUL3_9BILA